MEGSRAPLEGLSKRGLGVVVSVPLAALRPKTIAEDYSEPLCRSESRAVCLSRATGTNPKALWCTAPRPAAPTTSRTDYCTYGSVARHRLLHAASRPSILPSYFALPRPAQAAAELVSRMS